MDKKYSSLDDIGCQFVGSLLTPRHAGRMPDNPNLTFPLPKYSEILKPRKINIRTTGFSLILILQIVCVQCMHKIVKTSKINKSAGSAIHTLSLA